MNNVTRRGFLCGCSAAIAGLAGSRLNTVAFGDPALNQEVLVVVFLRGGVDGLNVVPPIDGADRGHYEAARPSLQIPTTGPEAAIDLNGQFG
ncbi:MAG: transcriptional initiation protein Tat, partial [Acidobacteriota bacterium]